MSVETWVFTVASLTLSRLAICLLDRASTMSFSTSISRGDKWLTSEEPMASDVLVDWVISRVVSLTVVDGALVRSWLPGTGDSTKFPPTA